jgi:hypothetical protein
MNLTDRGSICVFRIILRASRRYFSTQRLVNAVTRNIAICSDRCGTHKYEVRWFLRFVIETQFIFSEVRNGFLNIT